LDVSKGSRFCGCTKFAYEALSGQLDGIESLKFLFGEPKFIQTLDPEKTDKKAFKIEDEGLELANRLQQKEVARRCAEWITNKVEIRSIREANLLHGKLYRIDDGRREHALMGSSNFTQRGLGLSAAPMCTVSVLIHKPSITEPEKFQNEAFRLYRYATRLLVERVSWLCRDTRKDNEGDGSCELIFSNRSAMSYDVLRNYLVHLKDKPGTDARIDWNAIRPQQVRAVNHDQLAGLQMADAVASSLFFAVNLTQYSEVEDRYFRMLRRTSKRAKKCRPQVRVSHPFGLPVLPLASTNLALACVADFSQ